MEYFKKNFLKKIKAFQNIVAIFKINYIDFFFFIGWNEKIVARKKMTWFHFRLMKTSFLFLLQTIY